MARREKKVPHDPSAPPHDVMGIWRLELSEPWFHRRPDHDTFLALLEDPTCTHLRQLLAPGLNAEWQHAMIFALLTMWEDAHRSEARGYEPPHRRPGRPPVFPDPLLVLMFVYIVRQVFSQAARRRAHYWQFTVKILRHFFPLEENFSTRDHF